MRNTNFLESLRLKKFEFDNEPLLDRQLTEQDLNLRVCLLLCDLLIRLVRRRGRYLRKLIWLLGLLKLNRWSPTPREINRLVVNDTKHPATELRLTTESMQVFINPYKDLLHEI